MQTPKEALLAALKGEPIDFIPEVYSVMKDVVFPGERYFGKDNQPDPYGTGPDAWGVQWTNLGPNPVVNGNMVAKGFTLFDDIEDWQEKVQFPPLDFMPLEQIFQGMSAGMGVNRETDVVSCLLLSGQFERMNQMIGMENALCAFYESPEAVHAFFDAMCSYKLKCIDLAFQYLQPQVIHMHDDWGTNNNMFFDPELWREFIRPNEEKYARRIHELGGLYIHHSCGYIMQIVPDLAEIGVDAIEPMMVSNDLDALLEQYGDRITFMGGIDNQKLDLDATSEAEARAMIRAAMDRYAGKGRYLPYYIPTNEQKWFIYMDEVNRYGREALRR